MQNSHRPARNVRVQACRWVVLSEFVRDVSLVDFRKILKGLKLSRNLKGLKLPQVTRSPTLRELA